VAKPLIKERYQYTPEATKKDISQQSRLTDYKYPKMALLLPKKYQKEVLCKAHNSIFGGHDASSKHTSKSHPRITGRGYIRTSRHMCKLALPVSSENECQ